MNILLLWAHVVAEYDDVRMFTDLGYDVFSIGDYETPSRENSIRPPLPDAPDHPELRALCEVQRRKHEGEPLDVEFAGEWHHLVDWAKADLHPDIIDWADAIIVPVFLESWVVRQWDRIKHKRVIWRTCGQSNARLEETMKPLRREGLEIVRYSPKEEVAFSRLGVYAGADTLIRFGKYPADWDGWTGTDHVVGNVTQNMIDRGEFCGLSAWMSVTKDLPAKPAGLRSELLPGGIGALTYEEMRQYLRDIRVYFYTGTQPASYTLGLIEALMTGVPVVSIWNDEMWVPDLFEGDELAPIKAFHTVELSVAALSARTTDIIRQYMRWEDGLVTISQNQRRKAIETFGIERIGKQWRDYLGAPSVSHASRLAAASA